MSARTPTPWRIWRDEGVNICSIDGDHIATCCSEESVDAANAAFIVRAVNCHDELVEALQQARESLIETGCCDDDDPPVRQIDAAIAKARGETP